MNIDDLKMRLLNVCDTIISNQDRLTEADQAIGDGDHGVGMARGFKAARDALETKPASTIGDLFKTTGMAIMMKAGGASGAVFGTFFTGMAKGLTSDQLDARGFAAALREAIAAVQARGGARQGDKTMLDAAIPAAEAAASATTLVEAFSAAAAAATEGAVKTAAMTATTGKAKTLGERSLGHMDPGAISLSIILSALAHRDL